MYQENKPFFHSESPYRKGNFPGENPQANPREIYPQPLEGPYPRPAYYQAPSPGSNYGQGFSGQMNRQLVIEDAIQIARNQVAGEVISAELEREKGRLLFEIDILSSQGPVYEVKVDALTGEVLSVELD